MRERDVSFENFENMILRKKFLLHYTCFSRLHVSSLKPFSRSMERIYSSILFQSEPLCMLQIRIDVTIYIHGGFLEI